MKDSEVSVGSIAVKLIDIGVLFLLIKLTQRCFQKLLIHFMEYLVKDNQNL